MTDQRSLRVLFVDDETAIVTLIVRGLTRLGHTVSGFSDPRLALDEFRKAPDAFDVVITDLAMPNMSGFAFSRAVHETRADVPILLMSGFVTQEDERTSAACAIRDIIFKPITLSKLGDALSRLSTGAAPGA